MFQPDCGSNFRATPSQHQSSARSSVFKPRSRARISTYLEGQAESLPDHSQSIGHGRTVLSRTSVLQTQERMESPSRQAPGGAGRRSRRACEPCRRKKIKCAGERPICSFCRRLNQACHYGGREDSGSGVQKHGQSPATVIHFSRIPCL